MKNEKKLLTLLGSLVLTSFMIPANGCMVDSLGADCRTGFITGSLWTGNPVPRQEIVLTLRDIGEPQKGKTTAPSAQEVSSVSDMLEETRGVLEAISASRGEGESHRANIRTFIKTLQEVAASQSANPATIERMLSIIFTKYAG